jgi:molecular chaperone DnaK
MQLKDNGDKISSDNKSQLESAIEDAKKTLENPESETTAIKAEKDRLMEALNKIGEEIHAAAAAAGTSSDPAGDIPPQGEDSAESDPAKAAKAADVVDADFEVVEDEKADK